MGEKSRFSGLLADDSDGGLYLGQAEALPPIMLAITE
jgi:hypothetical protein